MKQTFSLAIIAAFFSMSFMTSCQKALQSPQYNAPAAAQLSASIHGTVVDENELPVAGAMVTAEAVTGLTDEAGKFVISDVSLYQQGGNVKVEKEGYLLASGAFVVNESVSGKMQIKLTIKTNRENAAGAVIMHRSEN